MAIRAHKVNLPSRNLIHRWGDRKWGESLQIRLSPKGFHLQTRSPTRDELKRIWVDYRERTELPEEHRKRTKSEEVHNKTVVILAETKERGVIFNWKSTNKQMGLIEMIYEIYREWSYQIICPWTLLLNLLSCHRWLRFSDNLSWHFYRDTFYCTSR